MQHAAFSGALAVGTALIAVAPAAAAPALPHPPATPGQNCAAGYLADPNSGNCWQIVDNGSPTIGGGPCLPGRVGLCVGYLANNPYDIGDTLPDTSSWP
ncbi:MAG: hypothetical protein ACKOB8_13395 [Mycobacterium sp.]